MQQVIDALHSGAILDYRTAEDSKVEFLRIEDMTRLTRQQPGWVYELINDVSRRRPRTSEARLRTASEVLPIACKKDAKALRMAEPCKQGGMMVD